MAEFPRHKPASAAHASNILTYGHFGTATYDASSRSWQFLRRPNVNHKKPEERDGDLLSSPFQLLKSFAKISISPSRASPASIASHPSDTGVLSSSSSNLKQLPELCAANSVISHTLISDGSVDRDCEVSNTLERLVFGTAEVLDNESGQSNFRTVPITAFVTGHATDQIVFNQLGREQITLEDDDDEGSKIQLDIPSMGFTKQDLWSSTGSIYFMTVSSERSSDRDTWFAAITHQGLSVFRPTIQRYGSIRPLKANHILNIPLSRTGGIRHAHAAFHTQFSNSIAIIDVEGNWSIWAVKSRTERSSRNLQQARLVLSGSLPTSTASVTEKPTASQPYPVGWHRICWLSSTADNVDRLLLCNRKSAFLLDLNGKVLHVTDFGLKGGLPRSQLLDIRPSHYQTAELWILTSSHLLLMSMREDKIGNAAQKDCLHLLLSWNHFRGRSDRSLLMHLLESEKTVWIVLSSETTPDATVYQYTTIDNRQRVVSDPYLLHVPRKISNPRQLSFFHSIEAREAGTGTQAAHFWMFKVFRYHPNDELEEGIYRVRKGFLREDKPLSERYQVKLPSQMMMKNRSTRFVHDNNMQDFIIDDTESRSSDDIGIVARGSPYHVEKSQAFQVVHVKPVHNLEPTYRASLGTPLFSNSPSATFLSDYLASIEEAIDDRGGDLTPGKLFSELPFERPYVTEIEYDSENILSFMDSMKSNHSQTAPGAASMIEHLCHTTLLETYDDIVEEWLLPLSTDIPNRTRLFRERLARQVAMDIFLSNQVIYKGGPEDPNQDQDRVGGTNKSQAGLSPAKSSPGLASPFSGDILYPSEIDNEQSDRHRAKNTSMLRRYTSFTKPMPEIEPSEALENILFHLPHSVESDPAEYDFSATEVQFATSRSEREHEQLDPRTRRRVERLNRTRQKRLEKQDAIKKVTSESRSAVPTISSSQLPIRNVQSSQVVPPSSSQVEIDGRVPMSMSQPERGVFGAQAVTRSKQKRKSGRNAGF